LTHKEFRWTTALACAAIVLVIINAVLFTGNRSMQTEINGRAQFVQQSQQLEGLFNEMVRALAELSARTNDEQLKSLLQSVGISFSVNPPAPAASGAKK
jgi:translation elongation factor EF-Ts